MKKSIIFFILTLFISFDLIAQTADIWRQSGPFAAAIQCIDITKDGIIYAGTDIGGIFKSEDNGFNWTQVNNGVGKWFVTSLASNNLGYVFASLDKNGILKTTNKGQSWTAVSQGLGSVQVNKIYIKSNDYIFAGTSNGIYRSTDGGNNWIEINTGGLFSKSVISLTSNDNGILFASVLFDGIYKSTNNGDSWEKLPGSDFSFEIFSLQAIGSNTIFAGTSNKLFRSTDLGNTWIEKSNGITSQIIHSIGIGKANTIFIGTDNSGIFKSTNNGDLWLPANEGLGTDNALIYSIATNASGDIFIGSSYSIFKSTNNGSNWTLTNKGMAAINAISLASHKNGEIFVGSGSFGIFKTLDNGDTWYRANNGIDNFTIYCLTFNKKGELLTGTLSGVFKSTDNGDSWSNINNGLDRTHVRSIIETSQGSLLAATLSYGVYRSTNNGDNWEAVNSGFREMATNILSLVEADNGDIYAGTLYEGLYKSTNNGQTWSFVNGFNSTTVWSMKKDLKGNIFIGIEKEGAYSLLKSSDNGNTWADADNGLGNGFGNINAFEVNWENKIFIGTEKKGVFLSTDEGQSWSEYNEGLINKNILSILYTDNGTKIAGTKGSGIWGIFIPLSVDDFSANKQSVNVYPHPVSTTANINFDTQSFSTVNVSVFDINGNFISNIYTSRFGTGRQFILWNVSTLSAGTYYLRIQIDADLIVKKVIVSK